MKGITLSTTQNSQLVNFKEVTGKSKAALHYVTGTVNQVICLGSLNRHYQ